MFGVHAMFSDHMVLQRDKQVPVWGTGSDGEKVTVECLGHRVETVVAEGKWRVNLPPAAVGGPFELHVSGAGESVIFGDVWFGDVWLAGGQSNMEWGLPDTNEGASEIPQAFIEKLRYYQVPRLAVEDGVDHKPSWVVCTPETVTAFSAVAYFFAKRVMEDIGVPIGIIGCNWGATSASCWVKEDVLSEDPELRVYFDQFAEQLRGFTWEEHERQNREFQRQVDEFVDRQARGMTGVELGNHPWPPPLSPDSWLRPTGLYHTMIQKAVPYALRGFLYYQGETDAPLAHLYDRLMGKLIELWRADWEDARLSFLFVQLPVYASDGNPDGEQWPLLREAQWKTARRVPNVWMAVPWEHGDRDDIHPRDKKPVGDRLALLALEHVYGRAVAGGSSGPEWAGDVRFEGGRAVLKFEHAAAGLGKRGDGALAGFEVAGRDGKFCLAEAEIDGTASVIVRSGQVSEPVAVRYGWANYSEANLVNSGGLPALPFRSVSEING